MRRRAASPRRQAHSGAWEKAATTRAAGAEQQVAGMLHLRDTGCAHPYERNEEETSERV